MKFKRLSDAASDALQRAKGPGRVLDAAIETRTRKNASSSPLRELLDEHDPVRVALIESQIRTLVHDLVWKFSPDYLARTDPGMALALSTHSSGYERECALDKISSIEGSFSLALILRRLNDWVPEVRAAAVRTIERCVFHSPDTARNFACIVSGCLELLLRFKEMGRSEAVEMAIVDRLLLETGGLEELRRIVLRSPLDRAGVLMKLGLKRGLLSEILTDLVSEARHPAVRRMALKTIFDNGFAWMAKGRLQRTIYELDCDKDDLAEIGLSDHSADIQRVALQFVVSNPHSRLHRERVFRPFVSSNHISLADRAAFGMKCVVGPDKFLHCLVERLRQDATPPFWAARLVARYGNSHNKTDLRNAYERLSTRPDLNWLELLAVIEDQAAIVDLLHIALNHHDGRFARKAVAALVGKAFQPDFESVAAVIKRGNGEFEQRGLQHILDKCSTVDIVRAIVQLSLHDPDFDLERLWQMAGRKRQLRAFIPKRDEVERLERDLTDAEPEIKALATNMLGLDSLGAS